MADELEFARRVPMEAYLDADAVLDFELDDRDRDPSAPDELWQALRRAAPHIRIDEINRLLSLVPPQDVQVIAFLRGQRDVIQRVISS